MILMLLLLRDELRAPHAASAPFEISSALAVQSTPVALPSRELSRLCCPSSPFSLATEDGGASSSLPTMRLRRT